MSLSPIFGWFFPRSERGRAALGDFEEIFHQERELRGSVSAAIWALAEVARSIPALASAAVAERGFGGIARRSVPALVAGYGILLIPALTGVLIPVGSQLLLALGLIIIALVSLTAGWVAAALAGAAPRLHALLLGAGIVIAWLAAGLTADGPGHGAGLGFVGLAAGGSVLGGLCRSRFGRRPDWEVE